MKKFLIHSFIFILGSSAFAESNMLSNDTHLYLKAGGNLQSKYSQYKDKGLFRGKPSKISNGDTEGFGYELAIELTKNVTDSFELGLGVAFQKNNELKKYSYPMGNYTYTSKIDNYDSVPFYATGKYNFKPINNWIPYLKGNLGYSFNINEKNSNTTTKFTTTNEPGASYNYKTKVDNGLYASVGAGAEYNNFLIELSYSINSAKAQLEKVNTRDATYTKSSSQKLDYSKLTLSFGYKFDF